MSQLSTSLTRSQAEFLNLPQLYRLFAGGLGSGKSYIMGLAAVLDAHHSKNAAIGLYEPSWALINDVAMPSVVYWLQQLGYQTDKDYTENKNEHKIISKNPKFGNFVFKTLDNLELLIGYSTSAAHVDEIDTLSLDKAKAAWEAVLSRNRLQLNDAPKKDSFGNDNFKYSDLNHRWEYRNRASGYTSPEGYKFCYQRWKVEQHENYACVHGCTRDNPGVSEDYIESRTSHMSEKQRDAYINGHFVNLASETVYYAFNRELHNSKEEVQHGEPIYVGCDFNVGKMAASIYVRRRDEWHLVDEIHHRLDTPDLINEILMRYPNNNVICYPDSTGRHRHSSNASVSNVALLSQSGFSVRAKSTNPAVTDRIAAVNKLFKDNKLFINVSNCPESVRCIEQQSYNKRGEPDKDSGYDHQNDATGYPIAYECPIRKTIFRINYSFMNKGRL